MYTLAFCLYTGSVIKDVNKYEGVYDGYCNGDIYWVVSQNYHSSYFGDSAWHVGQ